MGITYSYETTYDSVWFIRNPSVKLRIVYSMSVTINQKLSTGANTGTVGRWNGTTFPTPRLSPGTAISTYPGETEVLQGDQIIESSQKYNNWTRNGNAEPNILNHHIFVVKNNDNYYTSNFIPTNSGAIIQNILLDYPAYGMSSTHIGFADPWLIDYADPNYGNTKRNEGMSAPLKSRTSPFYPDLSTNYNGDVYQGIFLNQDYNIPGNPYYQVSFPSNQYVTINGVNHNIYFQSWSTNSSATVQNASANPTPVVFTSDTGKVTANVKASQLSNQTNAFINNSQRKLVETSDGALHMVYESMGHVFYETKVQNGQWQIMNNGQPLDNGGGKCPSIDYYGNAVAIVFQQIYGSYYSIQLKVFSWSGASYTYAIGGAVWQSTTDSYSVSANPNIAWGWNGKFLITFEGKSAMPGIYYRYGFLNNGGGTWNLTWHDGPILSQQISGTDNNSVNASVYANKIDYANGFQIAYEQDNYLKYIYYCRVNISSSWAATVSAISNISSGDGYFINYHPSIIGMPDGTAKACWIGDYTGTGSMVNVISRDLSQSNSFFSNGSNVKSASINLTNDNTNCYFSWSNYGGGTSYTNQFANISTPFINKTLNTNGQDVQLSNGANSSAMFASAYYPFTAPYYFITSNNLGSFPKTNPNSIGSGKGVVVVKGDAQFSYSLGDIVVDNNKVNFIKVSDTTNNNNINNINSTIVTEPFTLSDNSNFAFSDMTGLIDSAAALSALGNNGYVNFKVVLIDNSTGTAVGTLSNINITYSNLSSGNTSSYKVNTKGLGCRTVIARLTVSTNLDQPEFFVVGRYSTEGNVIGKSSGTSKEISVMDNEIVRTYALNQNYPNPFNPTTIITYQIPKNEFVSVKIFDALGREVKTLVNEFKSQGKYSVNFDASNLSSGVYFYQLKSGDYTSIKKMVLLK